MTEYWLDIGRVDDFEKAQELYAGKPTESD
jgi:NDP-sugar pyrophosphorylase family protein